MRLIEKDKLYHEVNAHFEDPDILEEISDIIESIPLYTKTGKWILSKSPNWNGTYSPHYTCSRCSQAQNTATNYCPVCGSEMEADWYF